MVLDPRERVLPDGTLELTLILGGRHAVVEADTTWQRGQGNTTVERSR